MQRRHITTTLQSMLENLVTALSAEFGVTSEEAYAGVIFVLGEAYVQSASSFGVNDKQMVTNYFRSVYPQGHSSASQDDSKELFSSLVVSNWRQFAEVNISLTSQLTIVTGENGTGKTTLLGLLGQAFGEYTQLMGTPTREKTGFRFRATRVPLGQLDEFGTLTFSSGSRSMFGSREWESGSQPYFSPEMIPYRNISGLYLDAQRVIGPYQTLESIPPKFNSASEIAQVYRQQLRSLWEPHQYAKAPSLLIKEALVAAALYGEGNSAVRGDQRAHEVWTGFQSVLHRLFPESLGFERLYVDQGEVIIETTAGPFALESASGGLSAIVTLAWQIYLHSVDSPDAFTVCFDEPENHLHPSMQRTLLPSLLEAFPNVRFVVATHSPFVVTSTRMASVFALRRNQEGKVYSTQVHLEDQALTANEILSEVLGVDVTLPVWAEEELDTILEDFRSAGRERSLPELLQQLNDAGLRFTMPEVSAAVTEAIELQGKGVES